MAFRLSLAALLLFYSLSVSAGVWRFYASQSAAYAASGGQFGTINQYIGPVAVGPFNCAPSNARNRYYYASGDSDAFTFCPGGMTVAENQYVNSYTGAIVTCGTGEVVSGESCVPAPCPNGEVHANTRPELNTTSTACVSPTAPLCSAVGVNPATDFVPKCSGMIAGSPSLCLTSDLTDFSLAGCPTIQCGNGVEVIYPAECPVQDVTSCPDGFTLSALGEGKGNTCVMAAPDQQDAPCVVVGTQTVCAKDQDNCVRVGDKFTCLQEQPTAPPGSTCYTAAGKLYCLSDQPGITTTKQTQTQPDGTTVITETQQANVKGTAPQTRTTTTAPDGTTTIKSSMSNDVTPLINAYGSGQNVDLTAVNYNTAQTAFYAQKTADALQGLNTTNAAYVPAAVPAEGLYTASGKTFGASITKLKEGILSTAVGQTVSSVFTLTIPSSSCPTWTIPQTAYTPEIVIDQQCAPVMEETVWPVVRSVLYVVTILIAITWAFL